MQQMFFLAGCLPQIEHLIFITFVSLVCFLVALSYFVRCFASVVVKGLIFLIVLTPMEIELLPSDAERIATDILDGKIPAQVNSMEVVEYLVAITQERGIDITFFRGDIKFTLSQAVIAVNRGLDMR